MPALDRFHDVVRNALEKDGWTITNDPLTLEVDGRKLFVDLGAGRLVAAEKGMRKIAVEVKSFTGSSDISDLHDAVGQFVVYRMALRRVEPERELFLAVPQPVVENQFRTRELWKAFIAEENGKVFGYDIETEEIVQWLP